MFHFLKVPFPFILLGASRNKWRIQETNHLIIDLNPLRPISKREFDVPNQDSSKKKIEGHETKSRKEPQEANEREKEEDSQLESLDELVVLLLSPALPGLGYGVGLADLLGGVLGRHDGRVADEARDRHAQVPTLLLAVVNREDATGGGADPDSRSTVERRITMDHKEEFWLIPYGWLRS